MRAYIQVSVCTHTNIYMYVYMYIYIYVHMSVYVQGICVILLLPEPVWDLRFEWIALAPLAERHRWRLMYFYCSMINEVRNSFITALVEKGFVKVQVHAWLDVCTEGWIDSPIDRWLDR